MNEVPLVSVVIPTYKRSERLPGAIRSVTAQTYLNLEILIVDDNDPQSEYRRQTKASLSGFLSDGRVRYIEHEINRGGAAARNTGISEARGEFVAFLDDDDTYEPEKIEKQYALYRRHEKEKTGLIYCYVDGVDAAGNVLWSCNNDWEGRSLYQQMLGCIAGTSLWFCPRAALLDVGGFEDTPSKQDTILLMKLLAAGYRIYRVPETLVKYYDHTAGRISGSSMRNIDGETAARRFARSYYHQLESFAQISEVEYSFAVRLFRYDLINELREEAGNELKVLTAVHPWSHETLSALAAYHFPEICKAAKRIKSGLKKTVVH